MNNTLRTLSGIAIVGTMTASEFVPLIGQHFVAELRAAIGYDHHLRPEPPRHNHSDSDEPISELNGLQQTSAVTSRVSSNAHLPGAR